MCILLDIWLIFFYRTTEKVIRCENGEGIEIMTNI